jgi:hypothetical protein
VLDPPGLAVAPGQQPASEDDAAGVAPGSLLASLTPRARQDDETDGFSPDILQALATARQAEEEIAGPAGADLAGLLAPVAELLAGLRQAAEPPDAIL